jgi:hypothetical protein
MPDVDDEKGDQQVGPDRPARSEDAQHDDERSEFEQNRPKGQHDPSAGRD